MSYTLCSHGGLPSSSLERPETTVETDPLDPAGEFPTDATLSERFRHSGWQRTRKLVYAALKRTHQSVSRIVNFDSCGHTAFVYKSVEPDPTYRLGGSSCRDRFCVPCSIDRSRCLATNVLRELKDKVSRFITLTLKQDKRPLAETLTRISADFRKLRSRAWWKHHVEGGCGFIEVKWSEKNQDWNVHLHLVVHGIYIAQRELSREWHRITGDSSIVDIRFVHDNDRVGRYVVKYVSKPFNDTFINRPQLLHEVITAMVGRRLCLTFGDWRGIRLTESPNEKDWLCLGDFHDIVSRAVNGDLECVDAVRQICGENANAVMAALTKARPPPPIPRLSTGQVTFTWPAIQYLT